MRKLTYSKSINEALHQMMKKDSRVFLVGQGCKSPWYVGNTCDGLIDKFGEERVIDTPVSENGVTGAAVGAALAGLRPIVVHPRVDFMVYGLDPIINEAANWCYMSGGTANVPVVIWGIINRGGEQAAQHSQALQAIFAHIPGLKVVMPSTPCDAKGLLAAAVRDENPVVYIDDRWLHKDEGEVPKELYYTEIGKGAVRKNGKDITIVGISYMAREAVKAGAELKKHGINAEIIDARSVKPLDMPLIKKSVRKTGRLLVTEGAWQTGGIAGEVIAGVVSDPDTWKSLKAAPARVALPDVPAPASKTLEAAYYPGAKDIVIAAQDICHKK